MDGRVLAGNPAAKNGRELGEKHCGLKAPRSVLSDTCGLIDVEMG